jgi:hypothetical protein
MAIGEQANDEALDQVVLPDDDLADLGEERAGNCAGLLVFLVDGGDSGVLAACSVASRRANALGARSLQFCKEERATTNRR